MNYYEGGVNLTRGFKTHHQERVITFSISIRFGRDLRRWKAQIESFPSAQVSCKTDRYQKSYGRFLVKGFEVLCQNTFVLNQSRPVLGPNKLVLAENKNARVISGHIGDISRTCRGYVGTYRGHIGDMSGIYQGYIWGLSGVYLVYNWGISVGTPGV